MYRYVYQTKVFKAQNVECTELRVYFVCIHGNVEDVSYTEMNCTRQQFMSMTKEQRTKKLLSAYV